jgi:hypothetical protein
MENKYVGKTFVNNKTGFEVVIYSVQSVICLPQNIIFFILNNGDNWEKNLFLKNFTEKF